MSLETKLIGPLVLEPIFQERIWGERSLEPWFEKRGLEKPVGEAWLTAAECRIAAGSLKGATLGAAAVRFPELLGDEAAGGFPLLIKILFPREKLSVQVHPNDAQALAAGLPNGQGKTECWYVLSAEPGATVAVGFKKEMSLEEIRAAIADESLEEKMYQLPVKAGEMVYVEAGTVHAIGPGVVILETQQYSDVTYRLFDYGRARQLHLDEGLAVTRVTTGAEVFPAVDRGDRVELVRSDYFVVDKFEGDKDLGFEGELQLLIALGEGSSVEWAGGSMMLAKAQAVVLPGEGVGYRVSGVGEVVRVRR